jgi:lysozyme
MDLERLRKQLKEDEGVRLKVYKDTQGFPTVGVGHLVRPADLLHVGDRITQEQCDIFFDYDLARTIVDCKREIDGWLTFPDEVQEILANLAYNLGITGLLKFKNTLSFLRSKDYDKAATALVASRWYGQVGNRSKRLVARLRAL